MGAPGSVIGDKTTGAGTGHSPSSDANFKDTCLRSLFLIFLKHVYLSLSDCFSPWGIAFLKQPIFAYLIKKISAFLEAGVLRYHIHCGLPPGPKLCHRNPRNTVMPCFSKSILILSPYPRVCLRNISELMTSSLYFHEFLYLRPLIQQNKYGWIWRLIFGPPVDICVNSV